jgi:hypothetical protein
MRKYNWRKNTVYPAFFGFLPKTKPYNMSEHHFNPNAAALQDAGIFGLPFEADQSQFIIIPVEWELTVSYGKGTADG